MQPDEIIRDPVFQLNLLLWMTREQPEDGYRVRPVFHKAGFGIRGIDTPIALPQAVITQVEGTKLKVLYNPEPDLRLINKPPTKELYIEAKKGSFGPESSNSEQARAHLLAAGPMSAELYTPVSEVVLAYHLPEDQRAGMDDCLKKLSTELNGHGLGTAPYSTCAFKASANSIEYVPGDAASTLLGIPTDSVAVVSDLTDGTDPSPLLLLVVDQDHHDQGRINLYRNAVQQQVIASLLCRLHASEEPSISISALALLTETSGDTIKHLPPKRQKAIESMVVENIFKKIRDHWKEKQPEMVKLVGRALNLAFETSLRRTEFLDWIEDPKTTFSAKAPPPEEALLPGFGPEVESTTLSL